MNECLAMHVRPRPGSRSPSRVFLPPGLLSVLGGSRSHAHGPWVEPRTHLRTTQIPASSMAVITISYIRFSPVLPTVPTPTRTLAHYNGTEQVRNGALLSLFPFSLSASFFYFLNRLTIAVALNTLLFDYSCPKSSHSRFPCRTQFP